MNFSIRFVTVTAVFITTLLTANIIGVKLFSAGPTALPAAVILFPLSYIFSDILTEVYGYRTARKVIWLGFLCNLIFVVFAWLGQLLPPAPGWAWQQSYENILGYTPRLLAASFTGYLVGEFANSFILAKLKVITKGRWMWSRTISSTVVGQGFDTAIFVIGAYYGAPFFAFSIILFHWLAKIAIEAGATPFTYLIVNYLKRTESVDAYDLRTNFNPFLIAD